MPEIRAHHRVIITSSKLPATADGQIKSFLPNNIQLRISPQWGHPLATLAGGATGLILSQAGVSKVAELMSVAVWEGTSPVEMTLPLEFIAEKPGSAMKEVLIPIRTLLQMALPSRIGGNFKLNVPSVDIPGTSVSTPALSLDFGAVLAPPGPVPSPGFAKAFGTDPGEIITIEIGKFLKFERVVITGATASFPAIVDKAGIPMRGTVELSFMTSVTPTKEGMVKIMRSQG